MEDVKPEEFLKFYATALRAQKQTIEEAWIAWEKSPAQEIWEQEGGFKGFLLKYLDDELKGMYQKAGVAMPE